MKIVVCTNCGAKYYLDDSDDVSSFECSACTGNLKELDDDINKKDNHNEFGDVVIDRDPDSVIVCCQNCGLKFKLGRDEDISEFECISCDGPLRYLDEELNEYYGLNIKNQIVEDIQHEVEIIDDDFTMGDVIFDFDDSSSDDMIVVEHGLNDSEIANVVDEINIVDEDNESNKLVQNEQIPQEIIDDSVESNFEEPFSNNFSNDLVNENEMFYSEDIEEVQDIQPTQEVQDIFPVQDIQPTQEVQDIQPAQEVHEVSNVQNTQFVKNGLVFNNMEEYERYQMALLRTYNALKDNIKNEYLLDLDNELYVEGSFSSSDNSVINKHSNDDSVIKKPSDDRSLVNLDDWELNDSQVPINQMTYKNLIDSRKDPTDNMGAWLLLIFGALIAIAGVILYILIKSWIAMAILLVLGIILIAYGVYVYSDNQKDEVRSKIIREKLEELPPDFYLFYYTKTPYANGPLNHVIVGPTGIYTILTQKYESKQDKNRQRSDIENGALIGRSSDIGEYMANRNRLELTGGYDDNQTRFQFGNEEIQFDYNNKIKHKSLTLNEDLAIFLDKNGLSGIYIEPLIGFINNDVAIINVVLTNEDLFMEELLYKITNGPRRLDNLEIVKIVRLLSRYSINCAKE
ncbi:MAG: hypothetical protein Q4P14_05070 [Methanobacteriaceae archaeon]|nr:hypothetical protein [Methanobacteriaceae archaeon]